LPGVGWYHGGDAHSQARLQHKPIQARACARRHCKDSRARVVVQVYLLFDDHLRGQCACVCASAGYNEVACVHCLTLRSTLALVCTPVQVTVYIGTASMVYTVEAEHPIRIIGTLCM
jgi:hypothetical protein